MIDPKRDEKALRQLPLDLDIEESTGPDSGFVAPEEAQRRSEMARMSFEELTRGSSTKPGSSWYEHYKRLRDVGWPWRVAVYIAWAASPKKERRPKTQEELATQYLGLTSDRQIGTWRRKNPVIDETIGMLQAAPLLEHRRDIYEALIESAMNPDYKGHQDRKLALEMLGDYVPRSVLKVSGKLSGRGLGEKSDEELRALLGEEDAAEQEFRETGGRGDAESEEKVNGEQSTVNGEERVNGEEGGQEEIPW